MTLFTSSITNIQNKEKYFFDKYFNGLKVNSDLDETIRNLKTEMAMRTLTWEQEIKDQVDAEAATIKVS